MAEKWTGRMGLSLTVSVWDHLGVEYRYCMMGNGNGKPSDIIRLCLVLYTIILYAFMVQVSYYDLIYIRTQQISCTRNFVSKGAKE